MSDRLNSGTIVPKSAHRADSGWVNPPARVDIPTLDAYLSANEPDYVFDRILNAPTGRRFVAGLVTGCGVLLALMVAAGVTR